LYRDNEAGKRRGDGDCFRATDSDRPSSLPPPPLSSSTKDQP
jgi:hypothetical protein